MQKEYLKKLIRELTQNYVVGFMFDPGKRPEISTDIRIKYISLIPLLEAIGMYMESRIKTAFDEEGRLIHPDSILDLHGVIHVVWEILCVYHDLGIDVRLDSINLVFEAFTEIKPFVEEASC